MAAARRGQASLALAAWESQGCPVRRALLFVRPAPAPGWEGLVREEHASPERQCSGLNACEDDAPRLIHIGHHVGGTKTDDAGRLPMGSWTGQQKVGHTTADDSTQAGPGDYYGPPAAQRLFTCWARVSVGSRDWEVAVQQFSASGEPRHLGPDTLKSITAVADSSLCDWSRGVIEGYLAHYQTIRLSVLEHSYCLDKSMDVLDGLCGCRASVREARIRA